MLLESGAMTVLTRSACLALALTACTAGSPLSKLAPQVAIQADPTASSRVAVSLTTWVDLATLRDAITAQQITTTLDGAPLVIDPTATGTFDDGDRFVAAFALPATPAQPLVAAAASTIAISDGEVTWQAQLADLFADDLAPVVPLVAGANTFEWPSAASASPASTIAWACVEVVGRSAACDGDEAQDPSIAISQQYITAQISGAAGDAIEVTGERRVNPTSSDDGPTFLTSIRSHYRGVLH